MSVTKVRQLVAMAPHVLAQLGRFCSRDPMGYEGGISVYEYCRDSTTRAD